MKKRIKLKSKSFFNIKTRDKILLIVLLIISVTYLLSFHFNKIARKEAIAFAINESKLLGTYIINEAIEEFSSSFDSNNDFWTETKDKEGNILSIDFNTKIVNKTLNDINKNILINLKKLEEGERTYLNISNFKYNTTKGNVILYIPFGRISNNMFFNTIGPEIPIKVYTVGNIISNIKTTIEDYGINNVLLKMFIKVEITERIVLPFLSEDLVIKSEIPVVIKLINGSIPNVYGGFLTNVSPTSTLNVK